MKNIRIDYYRYRLRKGRADILLQKTEGNDSYCIPFRYVGENEHIAWRIKWHRLEDDTNGDLVVLDTSLNDNHLKKKDKEWIPLDKVMGLIFPRNDFYTVYHHIFALFLSLCPTEGEQGIIRKGSGMLESVKVDAAKKRYVDELQRALERKKWVIPDATMTPPDPELVKKEIETLEHFRLYKPNDIPMNNRDGKLLEEDSYSYEPIEWEDFGAEIKPFPMFSSMFSFGRNHNPFIDFIDEIEEE